MQRDSFNLHDIRLTVHDIRVIVDDIRMTVHDIHMTVHDTCLTVHDIRMRQARGRPHALESPEGPAHGPPALRHCRRAPQAHPRSRAQVFFHLALSSDHVSREMSARYRAVEPSSGSNVILRRARPRLAGLRPLY